ncbi:MAG: hypothetical protein DWQ05_00160 [Calditrichaeota bacterium]|nr:MAG: hypothetical protein DWQ05_00160 [Calditrichota bacterium]
MLIQAIEFKFRAQSIPKHLELKTGIMGIETAESDRFYKNICFLTRSTFQESGSENRSSTLAIELEKLMATIIFDENEAPVYLNLLPGKHDTRFEINRKFLSSFPFANADFYIMNKSRKDWILNFITTPFGTDPAEIADELQAFFYESSCASLPELADLTRKIMLEMDAKNLITTALISALNQLEHARENFQNQTILQDHYSELCEKLTHTEQKLTRFSKQNQDYRAKLKRIKNQEKQVLQLHDSLAVRNDLATKLADLKKIQRLYEQKVELENRQNYFRNELIQEQKIKDRLQLEIERIGDIAALELDIQDQEADFESFVIETEEWLSRANEELIKIKKNGLRLKKELETAKLVASGTLKEVALLEEKLTQLRQLYSEKTKEYADTISRLKSYKSKEKKFEKLRNELQINKETIAKKKVMMSKCEERYQMLQQSLTAIVNKLAAIGSVDFDAAEYENISTELARQEKLLSHLQKLNEEKKLKPQYEIQSTSNDLQVEELVNRAAGLRKEIEELPFVETEFDSSRDRYDKRRAERDSLQQKLADTIAVVQRLEQKIEELQAQLLKQKHVQPQLAEAVKTQFNELMDRGQTFLNNLFRTSDLVKSPTMDTLDLRSCAEPNWWSSLPMAKMRLAQLCLSFACREMLAERGVRLPQFLIIDDGIAPETAEGRFRHQPILNFLQRYYAQVFFISKSINQNAVLNSRYNPVLNFKTE